MREKFNQTVVHGEAWVSALEKVIQYGPFILGAVGMSGLGAWFASGLTALSNQGWGAFAFAGIGMACVVTLVTSVGLVAWRYFRPLEVKSQDENHPGLGDSATSMMIKLHNEVHDTVERLERDIRDTNERLESKSSDHVTTMVNLFKEADASLARATKDLNSQIASLNDRVDSVVKSLRQENANLAGKVYALKTFYEMRRRRLAIDRLTLLLERPLKQPKEVREWGAWGKRFKRFEVAMYAFSSLVEAYYPDQAAALIRDDSKIYRLSDGDFAPENFPNLGTAHDFKRFRQMSQAYEAVADSLMDMIQSKT